MIFDQATADRQFGNGCALAIGNFDGIHLGHQALLKQLRDQARQMGLPAVVMSFEPLPHEYFVGSSSAARLSYFRDKFNQLRDLAIDQLYLLRFDQDFARLDRKDFVSQYLQQWLNVRCMIVGSDFRFGFQRKGDIAYLKRTLTTAKLMVLPPVELSGQRISSTWLRRCLAAGDFKQAQQLLGCPYVLSGRVIHGFKLGRKLGFATANIRLSFIRPALSGIFAVIISGAGMTNQIATAYISDRARGNGDYILEVFIFDFDRDIYGQHLRVEFVSKVRSVIHHFDSIEQLKQQIAKDIKAVRSFFTDHGMLEK